jgi:ABC-type sugar transport system substrate-binding protein
VRTLRQHGCSRIGYIDIHGLEDTAHYSRADRCAGYRAGMREAGLHEVVLLGDPHDGWERQGEAIRSWFSAHADLQALITYSDLDLDLFEQVVGGAVRLLKATFMSRHQRPLLAAWRADPPDLELAREAVACLEKKMTQPHIRLPPRPIPFTIVEPNVPVFTPAAAGG